MRRSLRQNLPKHNEKLNQRFLDQTIVVGLGNIYVDEALFKARIHPERLSQSLSKSEVHVLYEKIIETLTEAVKMGGSTVRSYVNSQGEMGMFQLEHYVYGRKGEDCKVCGTPLIKTVVGGRGTVYLP